MLLFYKIVRFWLFLFSVCFLSTIPVELQAQNEIGVEVRSAPGTSMIATIFGPDTRTSVTKTIPPEGGYIELPGIATINFPENVFEIDSVVWIYTTSLPEIADNFNEFAAIFRPASLLPYEIRMNTGVIPPASDAIEVTIQIPNDYAASAPNGHRTELFAQVLQDIVSVNLLTAKFSITHSVDGSYEAIIVIAPTPGGSDVVPTFVAPLSVTQSAFSEKLTGECKASFIVCPLVIGCEVTSPYAPVRKLFGKLRPHLAVDFKAPIGSQVIAADNGTIERSYKSDTFGETIVLRHGNGSATRYAHFGKRLFMKGQKVSAGTVIGVSDNTGRSTSPHLHFEYVPNGVITKSKARIDPVPCLCDCLPITAGTYVGTANQAPCRICEPTCTLNSRHKQ